MNQQTSTELTETEQTLAQIWREVVGLEQVAPQDNFFDIGGHSLLATKVTARIARAFNLELPVRVIFEAPTLRELAEMVDRQKNERNTRTVSPAITRRSRPADAQQLLSRLAQLPEAEVLKLLREAKPKPNEH